MDGRGSPWRMGLRRMGERIKLTVDYTHSLCSRSWRGGCVFSAPLCFPVSIEVFLPRFTDALVRLSLRYCRKSSRSPAG